MSDLAMRDLALALDFGRAVAARDTDADLPWLMGEIRSMFSANDVMVFIHQVAFSDEVDSKPTRISMWPEFTYVPLDPEIQLLADLADPIRACRERTGSMGALRLSDVVDPAVQLAQPHEQAMIEHERRHYGVSLSYVLTVRIARPYARPAAVSLFRDQEFSDRDAQLLDTIRPFIGVYVRDIERDERDHLTDDDAGLSNREREVLDRVAAGATNRQIAMTLGISPNTVRKHLERTYAKLEVSTRTAALAKTGRTTGSHHLGLPY